MSLEVRNINSIILTKKDSDDFTRVYYILFHKGYNNTLLKSQKFSDIFTDFSKHHALFIPHFFFYWYNVIKNSKMTEGISLAACIIKHQSKTLLMDDPVLSNSQGTTDKLFFISADTNKSNFLMADTDTESETDNIFSYWLIPILQFKWKCLLLVQNILKVSFLHLIF